MSNFLPANRIPLVVAFFLVLIFGIIYFVSVRLPNSKPVELPKKTETSAPFFIPPSNTKQEAKIFGRVVKLSDSESTEKKATHKIVSESGLVACLAVTNDDKLKQQEGNTVTLVGDIPMGSTLNENAVLQVRYILFK